MPNTPLHAIKARQLAEGLAGIRGFPRRQEKAVLDRCADLLLKWCQGTPDMTPEQQAEWLVSEAAENMGDWEGYAALRSIFNTRFIRRAELQPFAEIEKPPIVCDKCDDWGVVEEPQGFVRCSACVAGPGVDPDYLDILNRAHKPPVRAFQVGPIKRPDSPRMSLADLEVEIEKVKLEQEKNRKNGGANTPPEMA